MREVAPSLLTCTKPCYRCGETFASQTKSYPAYCKPCNTLVARARRTGVPLEPTEYQQARRAMRGEKGAMHPLYPTYMQLKRNGYTGTFAEVKAFEATFTGHCQACGDAVTGKSRHLDHCHTTGRLRGWLCYNCNVGLGLFKDDPRRLTEALRYLQERSAVVRM